MSIGEKNEKGTLRNYDLSASSDTKPSAHFTVKGTPCHSNEAYWGGNILIDLKPNAGAAVPFNSPAI